MSSTFMFHKIYMMKQICQSSKRATGPVQSHSTKCARYIRSRRRYGAELAVDSGVVTAMRVFSPYWVTVHGANAGRRRTGARPRDSDEPHAVRAPPLRQRGPGNERGEQAQGGKHYREFIEYRDRLDRVDEFLRESAYWERVADLGDLQRYCEAQYRAIDALCRVNRKYLSSLLPPVEETDEESEVDPAQIAATEDAGADALPIVLAPSPASAFKTALLRQRHAWIVEIYRDRRREIRRWNAARMSELSGILENLRSRPRYRKDAWEQLGLKSLVVSIRNPRST